MQNADIRQFRSHSRPDQGEPNAPCLVFLHEGLGSSGTLKNWPQQVCDAVGLPGLAYSRAGYGQSNAPTRKNADYMHRAAFEELPALLFELNISQPLLIGHSDGASIALLYVSRFPARGCAVLAPHLFVEPLTIHSITQAAQAWPSGQLRAKLARHHANPDGVFTSWASTWLSHEFQTFNIETECARISCPVLAIQGEQDPYGTWAQIERLSLAAPQTQSLRLENCGHEPQRDCPGLATQAIAQWITATHSCIL